MSRGLPLLSQQIIHLSLKTRASKRTLSALLGVCDFARLHAFTLPDLVPRNNDDIPPPRWRHAEATGCLAFLPRPLPGTNLHLA